MKEQGRIAVAEEIVLPRRKLNWAEVSLSEVLQRSKILESGCFNIDGKRSRQAISSCGYDVRTIVGENGFADRAFHRPRFKRIFVKDGIPIYTSFQCLELSPKPVRFISKRTKTDLNALYLKEDHLLLTRSGTLGQVAYAGKTLANKLFSDDLIRIEVENRIDRGFLYAFLRSKPGYLAVTTNQYGSVIKHIEPEHLENVPIPNPSDSIKKKIADKVFKAVSLRDEANYLLQLADRCFYEKLNLRPVEKLKPRYLKNTKNKVYTVKRSSLDNRIDGSYHTPVTDAIVKEMKKASIDLTDCGDPRVSEKIFIPGRFRRYYVDKEYGVPFLSGKNILQINPVAVKFLSRVRHRELIEKLRLRENTILITCSGTIGKVMFCPDYFADFTASQHILRLIPSGHVNKGYVYCFMASEYGQVLIRKLAYGSVVDEIADNHFASVPFPIPKDKKIENEIGNPVLKANKKRNEAWHLERNAISEMEKLIAM